MLFSELGVQNAYARLFCYLCERFHLCVAENAMTDESVDKSQKKAQNE